MINPQHHHNHHHHHHRVMERPESILQQQQLDDHQERNIISSRSAAAAAASSGGGAGKAASNFPCNRQSAGTRWIPTSDQIRILKELYYNEGVRSPSTDQIQAILARLRQYGKVEGKNVFYWFQNHKARERQKRRLAMEASAAAAPSSTTTNNVAAAAAAHNSNKGNPNFINAPGLSASGTGSSLGFYTLFHMDGSGITYRSEYRNMAMAPWMQQYQLQPSLGHDHEAAQMTTTRPDLGGTSREIKTLPLFPINKNTIAQEVEGSSNYYYHSSSSSSVYDHPYYNTNCDVQFEQLDDDEDDDQDQDQELYNYGNTYTTTRDDDDAAAAAASLELTLNSYAADPTSRSKT